jgi:NAD-dependent SIR2 family protein deacetylase
MVSEWRCSHCDRTFYSANEARERKMVICANCGKQVLNPYFNKRGHMEEAKCDGHRQRG